MSVTEVAEDLVKRLRDESGGWASDHAREAAHAIELLVSRVAAQEILLSHLRGRGERFRQRLIEHFDDGNHILIRRKRRGDDYTVVDIGAIIAEAIRLADVSE